MEAELNVRGATPVGMWADATPYSWDRKQSVELVCTSFPGVSGKLAGLRVPLVAWPKQWSHKETKNAVGRVLAWSWKWAAAGVAPLLNHDQQPFDETNGQRLRTCILLILDIALACTCILILMSGDWTRGRGMSSVIR